MTRKKDTSVEASTGIGLESTEVGYSPFTQNALIFTAAALGNMWASAVTNPLDIVKVRQQLRTQGSSSPSRRLSDAGPLFREERS
ncbi:hypothetical protein H4582DRAFT_1908750 [Lactarius indigo]|nr:hypothetical protein H4582DRAFT_1908750 [Lactarius indigo]